MKKVMVALAVVGAFAVGFGWSQSVSQAQEASLSTRCEWIRPREPRAAEAFDELRAEGRSTFIVVREGIVCAW